MKRLSLALGLALLAVLVVAGVRAATMTSKQVQVPPAPALEFDRDAAAGRLAGALRFRTISQQDPTAGEREPFLALRRYLEENYPQAHRTLGRELVGEYTLVYTWQGSDASLAPIILMSHQDVVPIEPGTEPLWTYPPFEGRIADGFIWGRGALDDKFGVTGLLEAAEILIAAGFQPKRTILFVFGHDEEIGGDRGALKVAELLRQRGVRAEFVLDEGGAIAAGSIPGLDQRVALIGTAEKGSVSVALTARTDGGHSSTPPEHTAVGVVSAAVHGLETVQMPMKLQGPVRQMVDYLGPELPLAHRFVLANLWLFQPAIEWVAGGQPALAATLRTTTAATMIQGGVKENVLPSSARAVVNFRILPGDSSEDVVAHARRVVDDERVTIETLEGAREPTSESPVGAPAFTLLQRTVREVFPDALTSPFLVLGGTDSRHFQIVSDNVYRFTPIEGDPSVLKRIHGTDERISVDNYERAVRFFARLMQNGAS